MSPDNHVPSEGKLKHFLPEIELDLTDIENQDFFYGRTKLVVSKDRFLGLYDRKEINQFLEISGIIDRLKQKGYPKIDVEITTENIRDQRLNIRDRKTGEIIVIMRLHLGSFRAKDIAINLDSLDLLFIDYLGLSDVRKKNDQKDLYPGQTHPGLGIFPEVETFVYLLSKEKKLDGVANIPEYYHDGVLFKNRFHFIIPSSQAKFEKLHEFGKKNGLKHTSLSIQKDLVYIHDLSHKTSEIFHFRLGEMIVPNCTELKYYLESPAYRQMVDKIKKSIYFSWESSGN